MPSTWTAHSFCGTRENQTSQNSRTMIPQRPKPTPTSSTRSGSIFIRSSTQKGICCQLLVPNASPPDVSVETREEPLALEQQRRDTRLVLGALPLELGRALLARRQPRAAFLEQALELRTAGAGSVELLLDRGAVLPERRLPGVHVLL